MEQKRRDAPATHTRLNVWVAREVARAARQKAVRLELGWGEAVEAALVEWAKNSTGLVAGEVQGGETGEAGELDRSRLGVRVSRAYEGAGGEVRADTAGCEGVCGGDTPGDAGLRRHGGLAGEGPGSSDDGKRSGGARGESEREAGGAYSPGQPERRPIAPLPKAAFQLRNEARLAGARVRPGEAVSQDFPDEDFSQERRGRRG